MNESVAEFMSLFRGRDDAHGTWTGGAERAAVTIDTFRHHLMWGPYIGIYPSISPTLCTWGCVDVDGVKGSPDYEGLFTIAQQVRAALIYKGCASFIERTQNGMHVWVFPETAVPAATMRRALQAACAAVGYKPKEVNPKQERLEDGKLGNYVRLPYHGYYVDGMPEHRVMVGSHAFDDWDLEEFLPMSAESRVPLATLEGMARLWTPPTPTTTARYDNPNVNVEMLVPALPRLAALMWTEGPLTSDRSAALVKFAVLLRDDAWRPSYAYCMLDAYDRKLGKFVGRADREQQLERIMEMVFNARSNTSMDPEIQDPPPVP